MTETVRFVSDGEELVTQDGAGSPHTGAEAPRPPPLAAARLDVRYRGFCDTDGRREYALSAQSGGEGRVYTLSIALSAFSERRAMLQDGPTICYQKLVALLKEAWPPGPEAIPVTDDDLAAFQAAHPVPVRRTFSSPAAARPASPAPAGGDAPG
jgi:hypothetical protein